MHVLVPYSWQCDVVHLPGFANSCWLHHRRLQVVRSAEEARRQHGCGSHTWFGILAFEAHDSAVLTVAIGVLGTPVLHLQRAMNQPTTHRYPYRWHRVGRAVHTWRATEVVSIRPTEGSCSAFPSCGVCEIRLEEPRARAAAIKQGFTPNAWELMLRGREETVSPVMAFTGDPGSPKSCSSASFQQSALCAQHPRLTLA